MKYNPGKENALTDELSRRPNYDRAHGKILSLSISDLIRAAYVRDDHCISLGYVLLRAKKLKN